MGFSWKDLDPIRGAKWMAGEVGQAADYYGDELSQAGKYYGKELSKGARYYTPYAAPLVGLGAGLALGPLAGIAYGAGTGALGSAIGGGDKDTWFKNMGYGALGGGLGGLASQYVLPYALSGGATSGVTGAAIESGGLAGVATPGAFSASGIGSSVPLATSIPEVTGASMLSGLNSPLGYAMLAKGGLDFFQRQQQMKGMADQAKANKASLARMRQYADNPNLMYQQDPGLLQLRKNAMDAVTSRQLASTGGKTGGNYARQLMQESAAIDRSNLERLFGLQSGIYSGTAGGRAQSAQYGGTSGGAAAGSLGGMLDDYVALQTLRAIMGGKA